MPSQGTDRRAEGEPLTQCRFAFAARLLRPCRHPGAPASTEADTDRPTTPGSTNGGHRRMNDILRRSKFLSFRNVKQGRIRFAHENAPGAREGRGRIRDAVGLSGIGSVWHGSEIRSPSNIRPRGPKASRLSMIRHPAEPGGMEPRRTAGIHLRTTFAHRLRPAIPAPICAR